MPDERTSRAAGNTIFAPASGEGGAAIAILRLSGPDAHAALAALGGGPLPPWRMLSLRTLRDAQGDVLDRAMVAVFPEGASYTGEAMAEIHCHGGRAVVGDLLRLLASMPGLRLAEPGEFTRRALLAGRMDLPEVEALRDLISAETSQQRRQALRLQSGAVSHRAAEWRDLLLRARALLEVSIDFADDDVPDDLGPEVRELARRAVAGMELELSRAGAAERMRSGLEVAIVGPPNVGKSSLLNAIAGREAAIVSEVAGTTRDVLELRFDLGGLPVTFLDTAGMRDTADPIETLGVERARSRAAAADLRLIMRAPDVPELPCRGLSQDGDLVVWAKSDLGEAAGAGDVSVSALQDRGIDRLLELIRERLAPRAGGAGVLATERQRLAVSEARDHLLGCLAWIDTADLEIAAEELRLATASLDRLVGRIGIEDVLGEIFSGFCLGK